MVKDDGKNDSEKYEFNFISYNSDAIYTNAWFF